MERKQITFEAFKKACELLRQQGPRAYVDPHYPVMNVTWNWWMQPEDGLIQFDSPVTQRPHMVGHPISVAVLLLHTMGSNQALKSISTMLHDRIKERARQLFEPIDIALDNWEYKIRKEETPF